MKTFGRLSMRRRCLEGATISELVRVAVRERYLGNQEARRAAMMNLVGLWKDREDLGDTETFIRNLRDDDRLERLNRLED